MRRMTHSFAHTVVIYPPKRKKKRLSESTGIHTNLFCCTERSTDFKRIPLSIRNNPSRNLGRSGVRQSEELETLLSVWLSNQV